MVLAISDLTLSKPGIFVVLQVNENSELYVCTAKFSPHVADVGFTAGLNDVVRKSEDFQIPLKT